MSNSISATQVDIQEILQEVIEDILRLRPTFNEIAGNLYRFTFKDLMIGPDNTKVLMINKNVIAWIGISQITIDAINQLVQEKRIFPVLANPRAFIKDCYNEKLFRFPMTLDPQAKLDTLHWCPIEFIFSKPLSNLVFTSADPKEIK